MPLQQLSTGADAANFVRPVRFHTYIADVSGSMGWAIRQLSEDTMRRIDQLPQGDAVLIGIFSSPGWYRWIVARELTTKADYDKVKAAIKEEFHVRATTCFSEIVADMPQAIKPFLAKYQVVTLTFMSDGCSVVPDLRKEEKALADAALTLAPLLTAGSIIAYGDYANRPLLGKLATTLGIELVATDSVQFIGKTFARVTQTRAARRKKVKMPASTDFAFALSPDGNVTPLDTTQDEVLVDEFSAAYAGTALDPQKVSKGRPVLFATDVQYAAALALANAGRTDDALQFLSVMGDVAMVKTLGNALTNAELARAEEQIRAAVSDKTKRFVGGCSPGCLPKEDAFDLLDLLGLLMNDPECKFYPRSEEFKYKRIGRGEETKPGYPTFKADPNVAVPLMNLVGHSEELNLSVLVKIPGTIELPDVLYADNGTKKWLDRNELKLPKLFTTYVWRNYSLVSNAMVNVTKLPVALPLRLQQSLSIHAGLLPNGKHSSVTAHSVSAPGPVVLNLTALPTCNRQRGKEATDWQRLADLSLESLRLGSILKVLKDKRKELDPEREADEPVTYTNEQRIFLDACGVDRNGGYAQPTVKLEATDVLDVRVLEVKIEKGSPVSVKDFKEMLANAEVEKQGGKPKGKKLNYVGSLMQIGHELILSAMPTKNKNVALTWLQITIGDFETRKRAIDAEMNARRFAIALTGSWARAFKTDETTLMAGEAKNHPVTLRFSTKTKAI